MRSNVENIGALERRIDISISQDQIQDEVNKRLKQLAKKTKMHGFRPGKVPLQLVSQRYGAEVQQEVLGDALNKEFSEAVKEHNLQVVGYPRYETRQDNDNHEQFAFSAQFEVYPDIVVGDLSQQTIEKPVAQVNAEDVDKTIEMIRKQQVQYQAIDRAVMEGDRAKLDYHGKLEGNDFEGGQAKDVYLIVGDGKFMKEFETALVGMNVGEEKSFDVTFPEDYHGKEVAGKTVTFEIKLKSVELPVLPEVDEEFAKVLGIQDGSVDKMRDGIRHDLEREVVKRIKSRLKEQAMRCLMDTTPIDAPNALVNKEIERLMENTHKDFTSRGMNTDDMQLKPEMFKDKAEHRIKLGLILAELLKDHKLKATPEQIREIIEDKAQNYDNPEEVVKWHYASKERLQEAESFALEENVVRWVLQQVQVVEKPVTFDELMGIA
ncbi:MAG: trigger factor [Burkholderiales bacterium]|nr:trigger factor [Nitrosomonas sp.]MCP5275066.1 trigger factor [Burkholderiales bacterium]